MAIAPSSGSDEAVRSVAITVQTPRSGNTGVAATLIGSNLAVTGAHLEPDREYRLTFAKGKGKGQVLRELPELGLTLLEVSPEGTPIPTTVLRGGVVFSFETIWPGSKAIQTGVVDVTSDPWSAQFKRLGRTSLEYIEGAPVVVNERLAGVVGRLIEGRQWAVIPAQRILDAVQQVPTMLPSPIDDLKARQESFMGSLVDLVHPTESPRVDDLDASEESSAGSPGPLLPDAILNEGPITLDRLTPSALRTLRHAYASAGGGEIHTEHLVLGLYENAAGSTRRIADARGITKELLREAIVTASKNKALFPGEYAPPEALAELPPLSNHTAEALTIAARVAAENKERRLRARHLLYGILSVEKCAVRTKLESLGLRASDIQLKDTTRIAGYASDAADGVDRLGVKGEALALATVLGAKNVPPPIAVGLLGTWGSGKSFFMHEMKRQFAAIEEQGRKGDPECCSNIVQIWFNAWHYIDANLWASLTSEIFDALDDELTKRGGGFSVADPVQERARLLTESAEAQSKLAKASEERASAEKELADIADKRRTLDSTAASRLTLRKLGAAAAGKSAAVGVAKADAEAAAKKLREQLGIDRDTAESLRGVWGRVRAIGIAAHEKRPVEWKVTLALAALSIALGVLAVAMQDLLQELLPLMGATVVGAGGFAVHLVKTYGPPAKELLGKVESFLTLEREVVETAKSEVLVELDARDKAATEKLADAAQREEEETRKIRDNTQKLIDLEPMQKMKSYVRERRGSTDYTKHLGVIATAHDDFARLSEYLKTTNDERGVDQPLVDRIVLYIDDLDRCPESKVVDVLQAVHLLLAFPLFVVVVGVDSRWLLHSLKTQMKQFSADAPGDGADALDRTLWESTPMNYLEKIFQIPFTLKPMQPDGFETLIGDLTRPADVRVAKNRKPAAQEAIEPKVSDAQSVGEVGQGTSTAVPQVVMEIAKPQAVAAPPSVPDEEPGPVSRALHLTFTANEIRYMQTLYPLMPSPRGAKRFVNLYRLLRRIIDEYRFQSLVNEQNDEHQAVLLLLAMLIGFPEETTDILQELHEKKLQNSAIASPWWTFVSVFVRDKTAAAKVDASRERWKALGATLERIRREVKLPDESRPCTHFIEWAEHVARFSFHSGRIVSDYRAGVDAGVVVQTSMQPRLGATV